MNRIFDKLKQLQHNYIVMNVNVLCNNTENRQTP